MNSVAFDEINPIPNPDFDYSPIDRKAKAVWCY
jgi:hypothetical protein